EVLSSNPGNFEGADILVVSFIAELIAGVAVPAEPSEVAPVERPTSFEPLLEPDPPTPQIAMDVPIPAAPVATPVSVVRTAQPAMAPAREVSIPAPTPAPAQLAVASTAAAPQPARVVLPVRAPEVHEETHPSSTAAALSRCRSDCHSVDGSCDIRDHAPAQERVKSAACAGCNGHDNSCSDAGALAAQLNYSCGSC